MDYDKTKTGAFERTDNIKFGNKVYIIERYFSGSRDVTEAINTVVINNLKREGIPHRIQYAAPLKIA